MDRCPGVRVAIVALRARHFFLSVDALGSASSGPTERKRRIRSGRRHAQMKTLMR